MNNVPYLRKRIKMQIKSDTIYFSYAMLQKAYICMHVHTYNKPAEFNYFKNSHEMYQKH